MEDSVDEAFEASRIDREGGASHPAVATSGSAMVPVFFYRTNTFLGRRKHQSMVRGISVYIHFSALEDLHQC